MGNLAGYKLAIGGNLNANAAWASPSDASAGAQVTGAATTALAVTYSPTTTNALWSITGNGDTIDGVYLNLNATTGAAGTISVALHCWNSQIAAVTTPVASPGVVNWTAHGFSTGQEIRFPQTYTFTVTAANATAGAIYTSPNGAVFTVAATITGGTTLIGAATAAAPTAAPSTLTKTSGTGDATINYSAATANTLPTGITANTTYFVSATTPTTDSFKISTTLANAQAGTNVNFTGTSSGTHSAWKEYDEATVTVNITQLSLYKTWAFFKFGSPFTLSTTGIYWIRAKVSTASIATLLYLTTTGNWNRLLRNSSANAAPIGGDRLFICGELVNTSTVNSITVTMNYEFGSSISTGQVDIGQNGIFEYGVTGATTDYYFAPTGDLNVWGGGAFNIGKPGSQCVARRAYLAFSNATNVLYGLKILDGSTSYMRGLQKSAWTRLNADLANGGTSVTLEATNGVNGYAFDATTWTARTISVTTTASSTNLSSTAHGLVIGECISVLSTAAGFTAGIPLFVLQIIDANTFTVAGSSVIGGTAITASSSTTLTFAVGDQLYITSSSQTPANGSRRALSSITNATTIGIYAASAAATGTGNYRACIANLSRNIRIHGISQTLQAYINIAATAVVDWDSVEMACLGSATATKEGLTINTTTGSCSIVNSVVRDAIVASSYGILVSGATSNNVTLTNNVVLNTHSALLQTAASSGTNINIDDNIFIRRFNSAGSVGVQLLNASASYNNNVQCNTACANPAAGVQVTGAATGRVLGSFDGNQSYSNACYGVNFIGVGGVVNGFVGYNNTSVNVSIDTQTSASAGQLVINDCDITTPFSSGIGILLTSINNTALASEVVFNRATVTSGLIGIRYDCALANPNNVVFVDSTFSSNTSDVTIQNAASTGGIVCYNTTLSSVATQSNFTAFALGVVSMRHGGVDNTHRQWTKFGTRSTDTTDYYGTSPAENLAPNVAVGSGKLRSAVKSIPIQAADTVLVTVKVHMSSAYVGTPRLVCEANPSLGVATDQYGTGTLVTDVWGTLSITIGPVTDTGVLEFYVEVDGTVGSVSVDAWTKTMAKLTFPQDQSYWITGQPSSQIQSGVLLITD